MNREKTPVEAFEEYKKIRNTIVFSDQQSPEPSFMGTLIEMQELYSKKNHDYGNSFAETIQEFGFIPAIARINDKLKRVKQMLMGKEMNIEESMRDNLIDIANYCVMTIVELDKQTDNAK